MFGFLIKKAGIWFAKKQESDNPSKNQVNEKVLTDKFSENLQNIKTEMGESNDFVIREFTIGCDLCDGAILFIDGLVDTKLINENIIKPLMYDARCGAEGKKDMISTIMKTMLTAGEVTVVTSINDIISGFLSGDVALLASGTDQAIIINSKGWDKRSVSEPPSEAVVRGPRESFIENLRTNTSLLRRKIRNPALQFELMVIGKKTKTSVCIAYIKGVAQPALVDTVKKRMRAINTDSILESGYIEQYIEDAPGSIFSTIGYTEKPDVAAAKILEGRVAIIVDGTPFVLTAPLLFIENFQTAEDYYFRPYFATLLRVIRVIAYFTTILAPALYVAITTFHQELIPTALLITMATAREGIPFPAFVESLVMIITFEILREAGLRLPRPVGQALSIVGALVIGESAVSAGIIGAPMVIVVAITAVSGFVVPNQYDSAAVLRLILLTLGATFGGFGITIGLLGALVHMSALESFGFSYLSPMAPFDIEDSKDAVIRSPLWMMISRPKGMSNDKQRKTLLIPPEEKTDNGSEGNV